MLQRLKALEEELNSNLADLYAKLDAFINGTGLINALDNLIPSMAANTCRASHPFVDYHVVSEDMMFLGPIGAILALISFTIDYWFRHRYRDDWEAYWALEIERFEKLYTDLQHLTPSNKISAKTKKDLEAIYFSLLKYLENNCELRKIFEAEKDAHKEKLFELDRMNRKVGEVLEYVGQLIGYDRANFIAKNIKVPVKADIFSASREQFEKMYEEAAKIAEAKKAAAKKATASQSETEERNWFDKALIAIPDTGPFNIVFGYAWNYWGVFFFTLWGIPNAFAVVPLTWGFLALIAPVGYLFYKEYEFYQKEKVAVEKDKVELDAEIQSPANQNALNNAQATYRKKHKDRQSELLPLRIFGWAFVALVASLSVGMLVSNYLIGVAVFVGISVLGYAVTAIIDNRFNNKHLVPNLPDGAKHDAEVETSMKRQKEAFFRRYSQKWMRLKAQRTVWAQRFSEVFGFDIKEKQKIDPLLDVEKNWSDTEDDFNLVPAEKSVSSDHSLSSENQAETHMTKTEKVRRIAAPVVSFFVGYMLGIIIGFATTDFLSHFIGAAATGVAANAIIGVIGLIIGVSFSRRAWIADEDHRAELQNFRESSGYCGKQQKLNKLNEEIAELRENLKNKIQKTQDSRSNLEAKLKLIEAPEKPISQAKILKTLRRCFNVLVNISSVMLMSRALLVMGFAGMFAFSGGSIALFGIDAASPFGIAVFSIAAILLILKAGNETYLQMQKEKELRQVKYVDLKLEHAKEELEYLKQVDSQNRKTEASAKAEAKPKPRLPGSSLERVDDGRALKDDMEMELGSLSEGSEDSDDRKDSVGPTTKLTSDGLFDLHFGGSGDEGTATHSSPLTSAKKRKNMTDDATRPPTAGKASVVLISTGN